MVTMYRQPTVKMRREIIEVVPNKKLSTLLHFIHILYHYVKLVILYQAHLNLYFSRVQLRN